MRRGDIYIADLEPVKGSEANKRRPVLIVSNNDSNETVEERGAGMITVIPLTTNTERVLAFHTFLLAEETGLSADGKAQAEQIRAISTNRLGQFVGSVPKERMLEVNAALRLHLSL
ncbi:MAG: type II toxin-antitoxin system PemK/MazF family toxin [Thermaceae bacterium]|nr:type II toxin-antitoxin system PemK/MazF family toxin [Thermaceae bacterium]